MSARNGELERQRDVEADQGLPQGLQVNARSPCFLRRTLLYRRRGSAQDVESLPPSSRLDASSPAGGLRLLHLQLPDSCTNSLHSKHALQHTTYGGPGGPTAATRAATAAAAVLAGAAAAAVTAEGRQQGCGGARATAATAAVSGAAGAALEVPPLCTCTGCSWQRRSGVCFVLTLLCVDDGDSETLVPLPGTSRLLAVPATTAAAAVSPTSPATGSHCQQVNPAAAVGGGSVLTGIPELIVAEAEASAAAALLAMGRVGAGTSSSSGGQPPARAHRAATIAPLGGSAGGSSSDGGRRPVHRSGAEPAGAAAAAGRGAGERGGLAGGAAGRSPEGSCGGLLDVSCGGDTGVGRRALLPGGRVRLDVPGGGGGAACAALPQDQQLRLVVLYSGDVSWRCTALRQPAVTTLPDTDYESGFLSDTIPDKAEVWAAVVPLSDADAQAHAPSSGPGPSTLGSAPVLQRAQQGKGPAVRQQLRLVRSRLLLYEGGDWEGQGGEASGVSRCGLQLVALGGRGLGDGDGFGEGGAAAGGTAAGGGGGRGALAGSREGDRGGEMALEVELSGWAAWPGGVPRAEREAAEAGGAAGPSGVRGGPAAARQEQQKQPQQPQQQRDPVLGCSDAGLCGTSLQWLLLQRQRCQRLRDRCAARRQLLLADPGEDADARLGCRRGRCSRVRWLWQAEESPGSAAQRQTDEEHQGVRRGAGMGDGALGVAEKEVQGYACVLCGEADDYLYPNLACLMAHLRACHGHESVSCTTHAWAATHGSAGGAARGAGMPPGGTHGSAGGKQREDAGKAPATHGSAAVQQRVAGRAAHGSGSRPGDMGQTIAPSQGQGLVATIRLKQREGANNSCKLLDGRAPAPGDWWSSNAVVDDDWVMYGGKVYDKLPSYDDYIEAAGESDDAAGGRAGWLGAGGAAGEVGLEAAEAAVAGFAAAADAGGHAACLPKRRVVGLLGASLGPHDAPAGTAGGRGEDRSGAAKAAAAGSEAAPGLGSAAAAGPTSLAAAGAGGPAGAAGTGEPPRRGPGPSSAAAVGGVTARVGGPAAAAAAGCSLAGGSGQGPGGAGGPAHRRSHRSGREGDGGDIVDLVSSDPEEEVAAAPERSGAGGGGDGSGGAVQHQERPANPRHAGGPREGAVGVSGGRPRGRPAEGREHARAGGMAQRGGSNDVDEQGFDRKEQERAIELSLMDARRAQMRDGCAAANAGTGGRGGGAAAAAADDDDDDDADDDDVVIIIDSDGEGQSGGVGGGGRGANAAAGDGAAARGRGQTGQEEAGGDGLAGGGDGGAAGGGGIDGVGGAAAGAVGAPEPAAAGQAGHASGAGGTKAAAAAAAAATARRGQAELQGMAAGTSGPSDGGAGQDVAAYAAAYIPWRRVRLTLPEALPLTAAGAARRAAAAATEAGGEEQVELGAAGAARAALEPEPAAAAASRAGRPPGADRAASGARTGGDDEAGISEGGAAVLAAREAFASAGGSVAEAKPWANDGVRDPLGWAGAYAGTPETPGGAANGAAGSRPAAVPRLLPNGTGPSSGPVASRPEGSPASHLGPRAAHCARTRKNASPCRLALVLSLCDMERMLHEARGPSAGVALGPGVGAGRAASAFFTELQTKVWEASAALARRALPSAGEPGGAEGQDEGHGANAAVGTSDWGEEELWGGAGAGGGADETAGKEAARHSVERGSIEVRPLDDDAVQMPRAKRHAPSRADAAVAAGAAWATEAGPSGSQPRQLQQEELLPGLPPRPPRPHRTCVAAAPQGAPQKPPLGPPAKRAKMGHNASPAGAGQGGGAWGPFQVPEVLRNSWNMPPPGQCVDFSAPRVFVHTRTYTPLTQEELRRVFRLRPDGTFPSPRSNDPGVAAAAGPGPADAAAADAAPADAVAATAHGAGPHSTSRNTSTSPTDTTTATDAAISAAPESAAAGGGERASNLSSAVAQGPQGQGPGPAQVPGDSYAEAGAAAGSRQGPGAEMAGTGAGIAAHTEMGLLDSDEDNEDEDIWMRSQLQRLAQVPPPHATESGLAPTISHSPAELLLQAYWMRLHRRRPMYGDKIVPNRLLEFLTGREGREMAARADFPALRRALLCHLAALLTHGLVQPMDMHRCLTAFDGVRAEVLAGRERQRQQRQRRRQQQN